MPKGVVLSHKNIQANRYQLGSRVDFGPTDIVFNALPIFHSFGLTGGTLLPILSGIRTFFYPSPLHYRIVPELVYDTNSTIMFGTDTFLSGYARFANPYDFYSIRYVFAGAEKLKEETRKIWAEKYGVRIFEGYGATETSPALSTNTPMHNKPGTVGRILPGISCKLESVPGIEDGGKLIVSGENIMKGYLMSDSPGKLVPPANGLYDTGDIVSFDEEGYITIKGRAKRFAKIAGEMISLTAIETYLTKLWPHNKHAVVTIFDAKKGEALVLVTDNQDADRSNIWSYAKQNGINELSVPKNIKIVDTVPLLGTGKTDYIKIKELAEEIIEHVISRQPRR
jgi:acyl-[acyl-carrier-protein]-phospholipid O-acyltransferase/long-chain-fatty-acid--[acyl-carrier-protein] ligase